mmetsp:Transcript_19141/g.52798  ORF Transcript_19141/g.52798 Transcript_19141/m.52798 type:complete len:214 (+) Transcript_19141:1076-1717(+)
METRLINTKEFWTLKRVNTLAKSLRVSLMAKGFLFAPMVLGMRENLRMGTGMDKEDGLIQTAVSMMAGSSTINGTGKECGRILMVDVMSARGGIICAMVLGCTFPRTAVGSRERGRMTRSSGASTQTLPAISSTSGCWRPKTLRAWRLLHKATLRKSFPWLKSPWMSRRMSKMKRRRRKRVRRSPFLPPHLSRKSGSRKQGPRTLAPTSSLGK